MVSWPEELNRREAAVRQEIDELRDQIEELTGHLADREVVLSRLEIARETRTEILSGDETVMVAPERFRTQPARSGQTPTPSADCASASPACGCAIRAPAAWRT
ncbi:hypothetical protein [Streptomyces sp. 4F14]|uniref:hypothetical protein n=1 Tax=Streptomyces sp. 4F14 TaxID=3394380 RepID=UPI003A8AE141